MNAVYTTKPAVNQNFIALARSKATQLSSTMVLWFDDEYNQVRLSTLAKWDELLDTDQTVDNDIMMIVEP